MIPTESYRQRITWIINQQCNFHCEYCTQWHNNAEVLKPIDINRLYQGISSLKGDWQFHITGGEPFLEKNFINICQEITQKHFLSLATNLSTKNVFDFADNINPAKCVFILAAVHIAEREKKVNGLQEYIDKIIYLQKKGFDIIAYYVLYPALFDRVAADVEYLKKHGVKKVWIKVFTGWFDGKFYPSAYDIEQKQFIDNLEADHLEYEILNRPHKYHGQLCLTGQRHFLMDRNGNLKRCHSTLKSYGNFFHKSIWIDDKPSPCPKKKCFACPYEGIENILTGRGNFFTVMKEDIIEQSLLFKRDGFMKRSQQILVDMYHSLSGPQINEKTSGGHKSQNQHLVSDKT